MKKNLWLALSCGTLLVTGSGCLKEEVVPDLKADPRAALMLALDNQASSLVNGFNKVIVEGQFIKNMSLENPPEPIPLTNDNEIHQAISYLLSNQNQQGDNYVYTPDVKICSEILAKNNPATCVELMKQVSLTQTPSDEVSGALLISIGNAKPFYMNYSDSEIKMKSNLLELVKAVEVVDQAIKQNGDPGVDFIPIVQSGAFELTLSSFLTVSTIRFSVTEAVDIAGQNINAEPFALQITAAQNMVSLNLDSLTGIAVASAALPAASALFSARNDQDVANEVHVLFPGLSGRVTLDNNLESIIFEAIKLSAPTATISLSGQPAAQITSFSQIDAKIQAYAGGDKSLSFAGQVSAQIDILPNALINGDGQLLVDVAQDTELYFKNGSQQAKVISGSLQLIGGGSFSGMMLAPAQACIEGQQNGPLPLQNVACE